jgi:indole-3-glycerol phosphate synthase
VSPLPAILGQIVENRRLKIEADFGSGALPALLAGGIGLVANEFSNALRRHRGRSLIAEVKMGSPRIGSLQGRIDPLEQARIYARQGAVALSVVVEPDFFFGSYELLTECRQQSGLPAIAKDFVVHPVQLDWARAAGADAVLLIAALFSASELAAYAAYARNLGLVPLIETHDAADVEKLSQSAWEIVGVNNRNLETFEVDLEHSMKLIASLPAGALKVSESGISAASDMDRLEEAGFDAFLVGETLLLADDPGAKLRELMGGL